MLNENIRNLRKQKGYSQETLAQELNVVRQTVSKWEKGYSVPDAVMLERMAELFEVSVSDLLGKGSADNNGDNEETAMDYKSEFEKITAQLAILNDQYAREMTRRRKIRKIKMWALFPVLGLFVLSIIGIFCALFVSCPVEAYYRYGDVSAVIIHQTPSEMFTQEEIASATDEVMEYFCEEFEGCMLREIHYAGDERSALESKNFGSETLVLLSSFDALMPGDDSGMSKDTAYDGWSWILARNEEGGWDIVTYGYA